MNDTTTAEDHDAGFADLRCARCGHSHHSHYAYQGRCDACPEERACVAWKPKSDAARRACP